MNSTGFRGPVSILSPGELFGGVETHVLGLCRGLRERGVDVQPILFHDRELAARLRGAGLEPVVLRARHRYDPAAARRLAELVKQKGSCVLHVHGYRATVTAAIAGSRLGAAVVKTEHGLPEPGGGPIGRVKSRVNRALDKWATRRLQARVCYVTADLMRRCERAHAGLERRVIYNGIDPLVRDRRPRPDALEPGLFHVGIVGRVSKVKGIPFALQAMASTEVPDRVCLDIIGSGPLLEHHRKEAELLGLGNRVRFHGFQRNVLDWLAHLDALLMPSLHEGLPYTLLEAMSLGVPIVASRVGGLGEVLQDGETGLLVEVGDIQCLARAIALLVDRPEVARPMGDCAARAVWDRFSRTHMVEEYLRVYFSVGTGCQFGGTHTRTGSDAGH
ncbi:MAG: glycosyltransferase family 4 protein [Candidatus Eisenbacteria sp.]|nr:glycosyltransferase family 4 protein [Candidatus Eisenbacteria bacterium]